MAASNIPFNIRLATSEDVPKIARFWLECRDAVPIRVAKYPRATVSDEDFLGYRTAQTIRDLADETFRCHIAIDEEANVVGCFLYVRKALGDVNTHELPSVTPPKGQVSEVKSALTEHHKRWDEECRRELGPHVYVRTLEVHPDARKRSIGTALMSVLWDEYASHETKVQAVFSTFPHMLPFYNTMCDKLGLEMTSFGEPLKLHTDPPLEMVYLRIFPKAGPGEKNCGVERLQDEIGGRNQWRQ